MQEKTPLVSIERVVAFAVGPAVVAVSGTLSAWLATKVGIKISGPEIAGTFAAGGIAAGGLVYKWLSGRQIPLLNTAKADLSAVSAGLAAAGVNQTQQRSLLDEVEQTVLRAIHNGSVQVGKAVTTTADSSPPAAPIPPAANDPAPAGSPVTGTSGEAVVAADAGAAPTT